jgi:hypothetical protein
MKVLLDLVVLDVFGRCAPVLRRDLHQSMLGQHTPVECTVEVRVFHAVHRVSPPPPPHLAEHRSADIAAHHPPHPRDTQDAVAPFFEVQVSFLTHGADRQDESLAIAIPVGGLNCINTQIGQRCQRQATAQPDGKGRRSARPTRRRYD